MTKSHNYQRYKRFPQFQFVAHDTHHKRVKPLYITKKYDYIMKYQKHSRLNIDVKVSVFCLFV